VDPSPPLTARDNVLGGDGIVLIFGNIKLNNYSHVLQTMPSGFRYTTFSTLSPTATTVV
jgi:hypothetical protein